MSTHGSQTLTIDDIPEKEKPQNGVAGLKHWRYDLMAGMQVAMVGIPLSLGIAIASGAPPVCGLISAIIAGFVFPFLGGAYITISGPAWRRRYWPACSCWGMEIWRLGIRSCWWPFV